MVPDTSDTMVFWNRYENSSTTGIAAAQKFASSAALRMQRTRAAGWLTGWARTGAAVMARLASSIPAAATTLAPDANGRGPTIVPPKGCAGALIAMIVRGWLTREPAAKAAHDKSANLLVVNVPTVLSCLESRRVPHRRLNV